MEDIFVLGDALGPAKAIHVSRPHTGDKSVFSSAQKMVQEDKEQLILAFA